MTFSPRTASEGRPTWEGPLAAMRLLPRSCALGAAAATAFGRIRPYDDRADDGAKVRPRAALAPPGTAGTVWPRLSATLPISEGGGGGGGGVVSLPFWVRTPKKYVGVDGEPREAEAGADRPSTAADVDSSPRIAVVGGGLAGVTAARSVVKRLGAGRAYVVVYEGDPNCGGGGSAADADGGSDPRRRRVQPLWSAALAKNANSLVPGAAMHVMSKRHTLIEIAVDTANEWLMLHAENFRRLMGGSGSGEVPNIDNFDVVPPYFALHPVRCLGPSASWDERATFVTFLRHFVVTSLLTGEDRADERGGHIVQLAKANRAAFLTSLDDPDNAGLGDRIGVGTGFLSLHRKPEGAERALEEVLDHGEEGRALSWEDAMKLEPRVRNLPLGPLFAVHRLNDNTADCAAYVRHLIDTLPALGVRYVRDGAGSVRDVERLGSGSGSGSWSESESGSGSGSGGPRRFRVSSVDGSDAEYDYVVLAAGADTPLLARRLGAGGSCPTYPLRGYSLTLYANRGSGGGGVPGGSPSDGGGGGGGGGGRSANLLNRPISVDNIYCSSVGPDSARFAGFGELVGYASKARHVDSVGPRVLARYARTIFPDSDAEEGTAKQCFRPMSPDDIPLAGEVTSVPGLFLHTGHGTLGWTLSLATAECLAQALCDRIEGGDEEEGERETFRLPDGTTMDRSILSPDRFSRRFL